MCFSPEVDLVAGIGITVVAVDALRHNANGRTLPLALIPGIFAVHTFTSMVAWLGFTGTLPLEVGDAAANFFMLVAFVLLPVYVPVSVLLLEPHGWRRYALIALAGAGAVSSAGYLISLVDLQGSAVPAHLYIDYFIPSPPITGELYVVATCGALLLSGQRPIVIWGLLNTVAVVILQWTLREGLPSLWCFWAACTSLFIAWYLRQLQRRRAAGEPWPWEEDSGEPDRESVGQGVSA